MNLDFKVYWEETYQIDTNTSIVTLKPYCIIQVGGGGTDYYLSGNISCNGVQLATMNSASGTHYFRGAYQTEKAIQYGGSGDQVILTSGAITHNADGTKSIAIFADFRGWSVNGGGINGFTVSGSQTITLTNIPRFATITSAPNFNDEENPTIKYSNPAGTAVTSLEACISLTGSDDDIAYRSISKTGTSYTFNLTDAERDVLRAATTSNTRTVRFFVRTVIGSASNHSYLTKTLTIVNADPIISPTIVDTNSTTISLTGDSSKLVRYHSNAKITMGVSPQKKATISNKSVTNSGKTLTADGTINSITNGTFNFVATDSRGNNTTKTVNKTMVDYVKLTCSISNNKPDTDGNFTFTVTGDYFNGNFGAVDNTLTVTYCYKASDDIYSEPAAMTVTKSGNKYTATANLSGLDYQTTYIFKVTAVDKLNTITTPEKAIKSSPVFDWGENDFNINGTLQLNGLGTILRQDTDTGYVFLSTPSSNKAIYIRPNGTNSTSGQTIFYTSGDIGTTGKFYQSNNKVLDVTSGFMLSGGTAIPEHADLNDDAYRVIGNYYCSKNATAATLSNCPTGGYAFTMKVFNSVGTGYPAQLIFSYYDGTIYYRRVMDSGSYNSWVTVAGSDDFVETRGTSGIWTYEKWASGKAVCWGKNNFGTVACSTAWGSVYTSSTALSINFPSGLFNASPIDLSIDLLYAGGGTSRWLIYGATAPTATTIDGIYLAGGTSKASHSNVTIGFHAIGTWK